MSNFFEKAKSDVKNLEKELLGPDYDYVSFIRTPDQLRLGPDGSISQLVRNVGGLINYVELLSTGDGKASTIGGPLGDSFFLPTGAKCKDVATGNLVTRSIWVNNIPNGKIPFITSTLNGAKFTTFEGLVPGVLGNLASIHPMQMFQAFMSGSNPDCQLVTKNTRNEKNIRNVGSGYLTMEDIQIMGTDGFTTMNDMKNKEEDKSVMPDDDMHDDKMVKLYYGALGLLGLYIFIMLFKRKQKL
jgi:hypothetical protein